MSTPARIGRYTILGVLGQGAMGIVYRGRDESLERDLAIKVLLGRRSDAASRERFQREARAVARLQHANIVTIYEFGEHDGNPFMAMEQLEGVDLQRGIEAGIRPDPKVTLPVVLQILAGLENAHENEIVHRDMKPSNVFLPRGRAAKIMDFGLARVSGGTSGSGGVAGTPNYMSPEQIRGAELDGRSDLFSTGLILYELVTGEKAFRGDSIVEVVYKIAHEDPDLSLIPAAPGWERLRGVLARALKRDVGERYPDARAMALELGVALLDLGGPREWAGMPCHRILLRPPTIAPPSGETGPLGPTPILAPPAEAAEVPRTATVPVPRPAEPSAPPASAGSAAEAAGAPGRAPAARRWSLTAAAVVGALGTAMVGVAIVGFVLLTGEPEAPPVGPSKPAVVASTPTVEPTPSRTKASQPTPTPSTTPPPEATATPTPQPTATPAPPPARASVDHANQLLERRQYRAALAEAQAVLGREPGNVEARIIAEDAEVAILVESCIDKAQAALRRGDRDAAMQEIQVCRAVAPTDARLLTLWREASQ